MHVLLYQSCTQCSSVFYYFRDRINIGYLSQNERANEVKVSKDETGKDNRKEKETVNENLEKLQKPGKGSVAREVCKTSAGSGNNTKV